MVSDTEAEELTVEDSTEDTSALEERVGIASDGDAVLDEFSLEMVDAAALGVEKETALDRVAILVGVSLVVEDAAVLEDGSVELADK